MERALSPEEKIRKAEEIYYRRKMQEYNKGNSRINASKNKKGLKLFRKFFIQIIICGIIYGAVYTIQYNGLLSSEGILIKAKEVLSYDLDINSILARIKESINSIIFKNNIAQEQENSKNEEEGESLNQEISDEINLEQIAQENETVQSSQNTIDSKQIITPLYGTITSRFGQRESDNPIVSKNHTGIDIAAEEGTVFKSSMEGIVELVSSEGELGNHLKITNENISTVYAHCKTIYVKEGDKINIGQELGEVGETGNATGPHLHFEIIKDGEFIDPEQVIKFE